MKRLLLIPALALAATFAAIVTAGAATQTVQVTKSGFTPQTATVNTGDTVTWHNADTANHQVVADDGSFASPVLKPDQTYSHTFTTAGVEKYHDSNATGSVTVTGPAPSVNLSASLPTITYGDSTRLVGSVSNGSANQSVTLTAQASGKTAQSIDQTTTSSSGSFAFTVSPTIGTTYQSHWNNADSKSVMVDVAPRVGFSRSGKLYIAKVTSDATYGGHFVWVQRHTVYGWTSLKRVYLGANSRAVFAVRLPHGHSSLRLILPSGQAGTGYVAGLSRTVFVTTR
ncbi:MAG: cupredoxin domain-containing protein [Actinobacteria bacterium]|nr:cupredoxin domain-containing protein [Actinomycetota bacterium]